jgi:hypothetical protein
MKSRTIQYFKQEKARKILQNPIAADLKTFLNATMRLSHSRVVKRDIENTLRMLAFPVQHRMSA